MPELPHLILPRAQGSLERRKRPGFGNAPKRDFTQQAVRVRQAVDDALAAYAPLRATISDAALIIRVQTVGSLPEEEWTRAGLVVLGHDRSGSIVVFASDADLTAFRARLDAYSEGIPTGHKNPQYNALIASIEQFGPLRPEDRIGSGLREEGFEHLGHFADDREFMVDAELWEVGTQTERGAQADRVAGDIANRGGEVTDRYIGLSFTAIRVSGNGPVVRWLLELPLVRLVDFPPQLDLAVGPLLETTVSDLGTVEPPDPASPLIGILDSGVNNAHPVLKDVVIGRMSEPSTLGLSDEFGHGSRVAGIAAYGNIRDCLEGKSFQAPVRILSGKVVNDQGNLDDRHLIASQLDRIVRAMHLQGCRIFNLSLGDRRARYT
jgi:hypothetical protein